MKNLKKMMKIGILQADSIADIVRPVSGGDYPQMFESLLSPHLEDLSLEVFDITSGQLPSDIDQCDGYLITGSKVGVYDDLPWFASLQSFIRKVHTAKIKLIGVCFGHQIIASTLGGLVEKSPKGWGVGMHYVTIHHKKDWMKPHAQQCGLVFSHQDQVVSPPSDAIVIASGEFCPVQMFVIDKHIFCMQCHPEMKKAHSELLMKIHCATIGPLACARAATSLNHIPNDGHIVGEWMVNFFQDDIMYKK